MSVPAVESSRATRDILAVLGSLSARRRRWRACRHGAVALAVVAATLMVAVPAYAQNAERVEAVG